jgi:hypothetical protein
MGSNSSKVSRKIPLKKPILEYDSIETPNLSLLNSVMAKYPVSVEKPVSISSNLSPKPRKMNFAEFTKSLEKDSYYSVPKVVQDGSRSKGVWH